MKFKIGDKVKLNKNIKDFRYGRVGVSYEEIGTIKGVKKDTYTVGFPSHSSWDGTEEELELAEYTYEDLKKSPIGTKITFENGVFLIKNRANRYENSSYWREDKDFKEMEDVIGTLGKIIKIEEPEYKKVYEYKPEILDETEKRYLRGVIRPFREKVRDIEIIQDKSMSREFITIRFKDDGDLDFPYFQINTMYKGMEKDKKYTLEELGL